MNDKFVLDEKGNPRPEPDLLAWGKWYEASANNGARRVEDETIPGPNFGGLRMVSRVSTVFLGLDHNFAQKGPPILWETMVFGGPLNGEMDRCAGSREQAGAMHRRMVERVKAAL